MSITYYLSLLMMLIMCLLSAINDDHHVLFRLDDICKPECRSDYDLKRNNKFNCNIIYIFGHTYITQFCVLVVNFFQYTS